jgi:ubiquinone/menaquinone biosynthesis C-methylase UbiE
MIARAKEKYPDIKFEVADALNLPFEENSFDVVLASSLINVLDDKQALLDEMLRVCKEEGRIMLLFPLEGFSNSDLVKLSSDLELQGFSKMALKMWHKMAKKMTLERIKELLKERDFEMLSTQNYLGGMVGTVVVGIKTNTQKDKA